MGSIAQALVCHPDTPAGSVGSVTVHVERPVKGRLWLRYHVAGSLDRLALPDPAEPERTDGLWHTTCFELFVRVPMTEAYLEYNFSPSSQWAGYRFNSYRKGITEDDLSSIPVIGHDASESHFALEADLTLPFSSPDTALEMGLSAVIEETDGTKSYWALRHPPGNPDFHHRDCFALELAAPDLT